MEERNHNIFQLDTLLPTEFLETYRRKSHFEPEMELLFAVLEDAVACYQKFATDRSGRGQKMFCEVEKWFLEKDSDWFFSFENICDSLELDPQSLRRGLRSWRERKLKEPAGKCTDTGERRAALASL